MFTETEEFNLEKNNDEKDEKNEKDLLMRIPARENLFSDLKCINCGSVSLDSSKCNFSQDKKHCLDPLVVKKIAAILSKEFKTSISSDEIKNMKDYSLSEISEEKYLSDFFKRFFTDEEIFNFIEDLFPKNCVKTIDEKKAIDDARRKRPNSRKNKIDDKSDEGLASVFYKYENLITMENFKKSPKFASFMEGFSELIDPVIQDAAYKKYIKTLTNDNFITNDEIVDAYLEKIKEATSENYNDFFSRDFLVDIIQKKIIVKKINSREKVDYFLDVFKNYKKKSQEEFSEYENFIDFLIKVKIYKKVNALSYLPNFDNKFTTQYMETAISDQTKAFNFTYNIAIPEFQLKYRYSLVKNNFVNESMRRIVSISGSDKTEKTFIDFMNFYSLINPDEKIDQVIYKNKDEYEVKQNKTLQVEKTNFDYFGIVFSSGSKIVFNLLSSDTYFSGGVEEIREMILHMKEKYNLRFENPEFVDFRGIIRFETSGNFCKKIIQEIFNHENFKKFWYTKKQTVGANNHYFVYWPENNLENFPQTFDKMINLKIDFHSKKNIIYNNWNLEFEGNDSSLIIPFIGKFSAIVHLMENIEFIKNFASINRAIRIFIDYTKRRKDEKNSKIDNSTVLVAQNEIAKREIYKKAIKFSTKGITLSKNTFNGRLKPLIFPLENFNETIIQNKWKKFYAQFFSGENKIFSSLGNSSSKFSTAEYEKMINFDKKNSIFSLFFKDEIFGAELDDQKFFLSYPDKNKITSVEIQNDFLGNDKKNSSRKKTILPLMEEIINQFTDEVPIKSGFYTPSGYEFEDFRKFIAENFKNRKDVYSLLKQHLWDFTDEEIENTFDEINIPIHQNLLENYHKALIFYYVYDSRKKQYVQQLARHRFFYCYNTDYENVMFIFKTKESKIDVVFFQDDTPIIKIDEKIRNFIRKDKNSPEPLKITDILDLLSDNEIISGQFFDSNGKSCGLRITRGKEIMDLRYPPQFTIYFSEQNSYHQFHQIHDSQTTVNQKFGKFANDDRFTFVPKKTQNVKYRISEIYEKIRFWKQEIYIFERVLISLWLIYNIKNDSGKIYTNQEVQKFIDDIITIPDPKRELKKEQIIEGLVVINKYDDINLFKNYLEKIYPNRFYDGKLHVDEKEIEKIKEYMKRELILIKNYTTSFRENLLDSRMDISLLKTQSTLSGSSEISYNNILLNIKKKFLNEYSFIYSPYFDPSFDPRNVDDNSFREKKTELILIPFNGKFFFIRMTENGRSLTAVYIAELWAKKREIGSYYTTQKKRITYIRNFLFKDGSIIESQKNNHEILQQSGEDYWILSYPLENGEMAYAAMLPIDV